MQNQQTTEGISSYPLPDNTRDYPCNIHKLIYYFFMEIEYFPEPCGFNGLHKPMPKKRQNTQKKHLSLLVYPLLVLVMIIVQTGSVHAAPLTMNEALTKASAQRTLSQRLVKAYIQVGAHINEKKAMLQLGHSIRQFEEAQQELLSFAPNAETREELAKVEATWKKLKAILLETPSLSHARNLMPLSDALLQACNNVFLLIEKQANRDAAELIDLASSQSMLSQRITKFYVAHFWGIRDPQVTAGFERSIQEFEQGLNKLSTTGENTEEISNALRRVQSHWNFSKSGIGNLDGQNYAPMAVAVTTETILRQMDDITGMYKTLFDKSGR